ncbi:MAG: flagellar assembly protein H [Oculatellaceae cyanobacterium Prado106]|jgi:hypothetical protein|nr:flagellar assembly protein H [Oculatellaceae cyanobacterium Prado106]
MTRIPFDQLAKEYLQELLTPLGKVERSFEVPGEPKFIDLWFQPANAAPTTKNLTLMERITLTPCSFEPFRNPPTRQEIRRCLQKLLWVQDAELRRDDTIPEQQLPMLWVLASTVTQLLLQSGKAELKEGWPPGVYFCGDLFKTVIVAIDQLPATEETLWLRVLGRDDTQSQAILEVLSLPVDDPQRSKIIQMLTSWKVRIEMLDPLESEEERFSMALSQAYLEWERKTEQRVTQQMKREAVEALLKARYGELDEQIESIVPQIIALPTEEYTRLILQASREDLLQQFSGMNSEISTEE